MKKIYLQEISEINPHPKAEKFEIAKVLGWQVIVPKGQYKKGDIVIVEFRQVINVAPGKYTLSFSCTHFNSKGELEVLNRKYDALLVEVLSMKNTVGLMSLDSKISITKILKIQLLLNTMYVKQFLQFTHKTF